MYLVHHFLEESARRSPDKVALICGDRRLTYSEINQMADRLASVLVEMGVKRRDRVAIFLDNSAESVIALFGILKAGAIVIMVNSTMKARKAHYLLNNSGTSALITQKNKYRIVKDAIGNLSDLRTIIWVAETAPEIKTNIELKHCLWARIISRSRAFVPALPTATIDLDLAFIIYTSGSTGDPKGVMCAHCNVVSVARSISLYLENNEDDTVLCTLPLSFGYGLYQVLVAFLTGGTVVLEKSFAYPYRIMERLEQERVTGFAIVPTMAAILLQMQGISKLDFSSLRYITNAAAALPSAHIRRLQALWPNTRLYSMYGLTECTRVSYLPPEELNQRPDSVGIPMPNVEIRIVDQNGSEVGTNVVGELVVRGSNTMLGYWNDPDETRLHFRPGGYNGDTWLYTGDLFRKGQDGYLYFVARKDDLIKTKGERVSPKEIEACLYELDTVAEAAVVGVPDDLLGQSIKSFVVPHDLGEVSEAILRHHCQINLEPFMVPTSIEIRKTLPKLPNGKIDKKLLCT